MPFQDQDPNAAVEDDQVKPEELPAQEEEAAPPVAETQEEEAAAPEGETKPDVKPSIQVKHLHNNAVHPSGTHPRHFQVEYTGAASSVATVIVMIDAPGAEQVYAEKYVHTNESGHGTVDIDWSIGDGAGAGRVSIWGSKSNEGGETARQEFDFEVVDDKEGVPEAVAENANDDDPNDLEQQLAG